MNENYDSAPETRRHINFVSYLLYLCSKELQNRGEVHDASKLVEPEKSLFDIATPKLKNLTYGTEEYKQAVRDLGPAIEHHYQNNSHHPEYYKDGIDGMDLFDVMEMLMDWRAASARHNDGCIKKSLEINKGRFKIDDQLYSILKNTIERMDLANVKPEDDNDGTHL